MTQLYRLPNRLEVSITDHLFALELSHDHNDYDFDWLLIGLLRLSFFIRVPKMLHGYRLEQSYGIKVLTDTIHLHWNEAAKVLWYPWTWTLAREWELVRNRGPSWRGVEEAFVEVPRGFASGQLATHWTFPYSYKLNDGRVQRRNADVYVTRREDRWLALLWLPFPRQRSDSIWVAFDGEVGEGEGSWKGGVMGCGYTMLPGETAEQTLRRMERERRFPR